MMRNLGGHDILLGRFAGIDNSDRGDFLGPLRCARVQTAVQKVFDDLCLGFYAEVYKIRHCTRGAESG